MFRYIFVFLFLISSVFSTDTTVFADAALPQTAPNYSGSTFSEADQIATDVGVRQGSWFSSSDSTMQVINNGLLKINNQQAELKAHGVSEAAMATQRAEAVDSLKDYAKASYAQENPSLLKIWRTDDIEKGNLFKAQANFEKTIQLGYAKNGMEKEAQIGKDIVAELDAKANQYHSDSLPGSNEFTGNKTLDGLIGQAITPQGKTYILLAPVETFFPGGVVDVAGGGLGTYLNNLYRIGIAVATGLCLIMIVIGGLEYVASGTVGGKSDGREKIVNAGKGLLLALCSYLILQQINPNLLRNDFNIDATKSGGTIAQVDYELTRGEQTGVLAGMPYTQQYITVLNSAIPTATQASGFKTMGFSNMEWQAYAARLVQTTGLINYRPTDAASFFPNGQVTVEGWVGIIGGIIKKESNFRPTLVFPEPAPLNYNSVGLLQLSAVDAEAKALRCNETCLKDPFKNLEVGIAIMARQIRKDNCIRCKSSGGAWRGLAAYWSTIR